MLEGKLPPLIGVRHVAFATRDLTAAIAFYRDVLGFSMYHVSDPDWAMLSLGDTTLSLIRASAAAVDGAGGSHHAHVGLNAPTPEAVEGWHRKLATVLPAIGRVTRHRDGSYGFYFRDLDGNPLELIFIPFRAGKVPATEAWLLLGWGGADPSGRRALEVLIERVRIHAPGVRCELAFLEGELPDMATVLDRWEKHGLPERVRVFPIGSSGTAAVHEIPQLLAAAATRYPHTRFQRESSVGENVMVLEAIAAAIAETK